MHWQISLSELMRIICENVHVHERGCVRACVRVCVSVYVRVRSDVCVPNVDVGGRKVYATDDKQLYDN